MRASLVVFVIACSSKDPEPPPQQRAVVVETQTCAIAVANAMTIARREMTRAAPDMIPLLPKITELTVKRCSDDGWSQQAIACMATARRPSDTDRCQTLLTADQQLAVQRDMQTVK